MISPPDFNAKQIVLVFTQFGDKLSFRNDNLILTDQNGVIKLQCTCYRIFVVFIVGNISITSGIIQRSRKFGFQIALLTYNFKPYQMIGIGREGNTVLRNLQYHYESSKLAKKITVNKMTNQKKALQNLRKKTKSQRDAILRIDEYCEAVQSCGSITEIMGYEGSASRIYFKNYFSMIEWKGRKPRIKNDPVNTLLDIGYSILFSYIEVILNCFGFDLYCGVMHRAFYMRKSLVCDLVEPFRVLIEHRIRKAINLHQFSPDDFDLVNGQYLLKREKNVTYLRWMVEPIVENRENIFLYIQSYYRAFMKKKDVSFFPVYEFSEKKDG